MGDRPRVLVFTGPDTAAAKSPDALAPQCDVVSARSLQEGAALLHSQPFDGLYVTAQARALWQRAVELLQHESILEELGEGVAIIQPDLHIVWANATFDEWCGAPSRGQNFYEALGSPTILGPDHAPLHTALANKTTSTRLLAASNRYLELRLAPLDEGGKVVQVTALCRDITAEVLQQQKLDVLHLASQELAALQPEQLAEMSVEERLELLKHNIRRLTHELLHYDVIEIRLLDPRTGELRLLLAEGMTTEAAQRRLYARPEGNGVTGYVAATGKTYVCNDTAADPLYLQGAAGARSSLTVALVQGDKVIGTLNVESPRTGAFGPQDVQFTEIFCRELAGALCTLDLLSVEKQATASQSIEAVSREVSMPVDEILTAATSLLDRSGQQHDDSALRLRQIIAAARAIKQSIQKVGEELAPQASPLASTPVAPPHRLSLRVLVVDNDERVRRSAHSILGRLGCIVETARDGKEALTLARLSSYDAVLTDIRLPDLTGYDLYRALRQAQPEANVILMTGFGYDSTHSIVKARQDGLRFVLYKPFRVDQLVAALETAPPRLGQKERTLEPR